MRTLVLGAGVVLVAALGVFLVRGNWKKPLSWKELPKRLGVDIQSDATGFTLERAVGAHGRYKIHASKAVEFKQGNAELHDVKIELYGEDGKTADRIEGAEFEYDRNSETVKAAGPVEITLVKPPAPARPGSGAESSHAAGRETVEHQLETAQQIAARGEVRVETSGLVFDQKSGVAATDEHVHFSMAQGSGSSMGATYDSKSGVLVLDREVELNADHGGNPVEIRAQHAQFFRSEKICRMRAAVADYRGGEAKAADATILFREDGSAERLDAAHGFAVSSSNGGTIEAPTARMDFDERNLPRRGHMEGGVRLALDRSAANGSSEGHVDGTAPTMDLVFDKGGYLRHAHLERGVRMTSVQWNGEGANRVQTRRTWESPIADVTFRKTAAGEGSKSTKEGGTPRRTQQGHEPAGRIEPETIAGIDRVTITSQSRQGAKAAIPSSLSADTLTGFFGPGSVLTAMTGIGHARVEETSASGVKQTSTGDRLDAKLNSGPKKMESAKNESAGMGQVDSAVLVGHVTMVQEPAAGGHSGTMRAWASRAEYESAGEWLRLTGSPEVEDGTLDVTADRMDISRQTGDAYGRGHVKATSLGDGGTGLRSGASAAAGGNGLGGQAPTHAIAAEAHLQQAPGAAAGAAASLVTFSGHARLWQDANSVAGPEIVLDRERQTLAARSTDAREPVTVVLLSAGDKSAQNSTASGAGHGAGKSPGPNKAGPSVITVKGGDLKYSGAERKAVMKSGALGAVTAETAASGSTSNEVELVLLPAGNRADKDGNAARVDRMTARGHVAIMSEGRRGTGEKLVYTAESGEYVLTGTTAAPPRMNDPARGSATGEALIFDGRDDSVSIEGGGQRTTTETTAPK